MSEDPKIDDLKMQVQSFAAAGEVTEGEVSISMNYQAACEYTRHEFSALFKDLPIEAFQELVVDIQVHALRDPITLYGGKILDGWQRYRACVAAGVEPRFEEFNGDDTDALAFVFSRNRHRRHLTSSQMAMVVADAREIFKKLSANLRSGEKLSKKASQILGGVVSSRSIESGVRVKQQGTAHLQQAVRENAIAVSAAAEIATLPKPEQDSIISLGYDHVKKVAATMRHDREQRKKEVTFQQKHEVFRIINDPERLAEGIFRGEPSRPFLPQELWGKPSLEWPSDLRDQFTIWLDGHIVLLDDQRQKMEKNLKMINLEIRRCTEQRTVIEQGERPIEPSDCPIELKELGKVTLLPYGKTHKEQ